LKEGDRKVRENVQGMLPSVTLARYPLNNYGCSATPGILHPQGR
jgi:hypothetical protein